MGLPEVNLGIIPGAEGTQRLPRLVGVEKAIQMCVSGKPIRAAEALEAGLIDQIAERDLIAAATELARTAARPGARLPRTSERVASTRSSVSGHSRLTSVGSRNHEDHEVHEDMLYTACMFRNFVPS